MTNSGDSLEALEPFVGEWRLVAVFKVLPPADIGARVTFEWLPGKRFLIQRWEVPIPEAPDGIAIIGADPESAGNYLQHYFDSRGVARVYKMSFADGVWKLWRDEPDFSRSTSPSATPAPSATTASRSLAPGRSATTARPGSTTSISPTPGLDGRTPQSRVSQPAPRLRVVLTAEPCRLGPPIVPGFLHDRGDLRVGGEALPTCRRPSRRAPRPGPARSGRGRRSRPWNRAAVASRRPWSRRC